MRGWRTIAYLLLLASVSFGETKRKLVVIEVDGLDARYLRDADRLHLKIPTLRRLARQGAVAEGVIGVTPDNSWSAATTMITGVTPRRHGILDGKGAKLAPGVQTLSQAAGADHLKIAMLFWPATAKIAADFNCPQSFSGETQADLAFELISSQCTPGLVQRITSVYPVFSKSQWNDSTALIGLRYLLQYEKPDLSLVHIADLAQEQRDTGALSLYAREVLENQDEMIGQALGSLAPNTQVAVLSDHGFETEDFIVKPRVLIGSRTVQIRDGLIGATNPADAAALRKLVGSRKSGIAREVPLEEARQFVPEATTWSAAFGTAPNYVATEAESGKALSIGSHKGVHSFWPLRPNFRSTLILTGDQIRPMRLPEISMLRIAPTLADILGVKLPDAHEASLWPQIKK